MSESISKADIGVVIVSYNVSSYLRDCLLSVQQQFSGMNYRVIVVDNHSNDGTVKMMRREFPGIQLVETGSNLGFGRGMNIGAKAIVADNYLILNPDTIITSSIVQKMSDHLRVNSKAGVVGCRMLSPDGSIQPCIYDLPTISVTILGLLGAKKLLANKAVAAIANMFASGGLMTDYIAPEEFASAYRSVQSVPGSCFLIRSCLYALLHGYDENIFLYYEDADLFFRVVNEQKQELHLLSDTGVLHHVGKSFQAEFSDISPRKYWSLLYYFWKNKPYWQYLALRAVLFFVLSVRILSSKGEAYQRDCFQGMRMCLLGYSSYNPFPS